MGKKNPTSKKPKGDKSFSELPRSVSKDDEGLPAIKISILPNKFELGAIRLVELNSQLDLQGPLPKETKLKVDSSAAVNTDGFLLVNINCTAKKETEDEDNKSSLSISVVYQSVFEIEPTETAEIEAISKYSTEIADIAVNTTWPFIREIVHSVSSKMGVQPIVLPLFLSKVDKVD